MSAPLRGARAALFALVLIALPALADSKTDAPKTDAAHDAMAEAMAKLAAPGAPHQALAANAGKWKATVKSWFAPGEPTVTTGSSQNTMILGGRFLEQKFAGTMMGRPFEGYGLTGYDNGSGKYQSFWIDNAGTAMMLMSGSADAAGTTITMTGTMNMPDGSASSVKGVTRIVDPKTHVFSMYGTMGEQEQLMMEITYRK